MDKAKGGVETGIISHVSACAMPLLMFALCEHAPACKFYVVEPYTRMGHLVAQNKHPTSCPYLADLMGGVPKHTLEPRLPGCPSVFIYQKMTNGLCYISSYIKSPDVM